MKYLHKFSLSIIVFVFATAFQEPKQGTSNSILWKVTGNELQYPSYLFGTIHLIPKDSFYFPDFMEERLKKSEVLVTEILMDIPLKEQIILAQRMMLPEGKTFQNYMSEDEYSRFESFLLDSLGISSMKVNAFSKLKPAFVPGLILNELVKKPTAYEIELTRISKKSKLEYDFLETVNEQLDILDRIELEEVFEYFSTDFDILEEYNELLDKYLDEDIYSIYEDMKNDTTFDSYEGTLLQERNQKWIPKIDSLINVKSCFIAVGAGHLPGEDGLINLLRDKGYKVTPVKE